MKQLQIVELQLTKNTYFFIKPLIKYLGHIILIKFKNLPRKKINKFRAVKNYHKLMYKKQKT